MQYESSRARRPGLQRMNRRQGSKFHGGYLLCASTLPSGTDAAAFTVLPTPHEVPIPIPFYKVAN